MTYLKNQKTLVISGYFTPIICRTFHNVKLVKLTFAKVVKIVNYMLTEINAGYLYKNRLFPNNQDTPQGGIISPTLANMTLDGMENIIAANFWTNKHGKIDKKHHNTYQINLVRYADDFVVTTNSKEKAYEIKTVLEAFMSERGLTLSEEKTAITHIIEGFDFLGWEFRESEKPTIWGII